MTDQLLGGGLLFCDARFHDLNEVPAARRWRYEHRRDGRLVGVLDGVVTDGVLLSGHSAPFGGPDLARPDPTVEDLRTLVTGALAAARADGLAAVRIRARPPVYSAAEPLLEYVLLNTGFTVEHCDLNMHIELPPAVDPMGLLKERKRRYVRTALNQPFEYVYVTDEVDLTTCHAVLAENRAAHGRPPGLTREYLQRAQEAFPDRVRFRLLRLGGQPVAAAVVYRVLDGVDQVVHWGDSGHGLARSPMDLLAHLVTVEARDTGALVLDLGPSSTKDGPPDVGLTNFKRSVGAVPGTRKVFLARLG